MFINSICDVLASHQKSFNGKATLAKLFSMSLETIEDRFMFFLELCTYVRSLGIQSIGDGKNSIPNLNFIRTTLIQTNTMSHSTSVVAFAFERILKELSQELFLATNRQPNYDLILDIFIKKIPASKFLEIPKDTSLYNKVFSLKGASGKEYTGAGIMDISKYNTEDLIDILKGMNIEGENAKIRDWILDNPKDIKDKFSNHRTGMIAFTRYILDEGKTKSKVVDFVQKILSGEAIVKNVKTDKKADKKSEKKVEKKEKETEKKVSDKQFLDETVGETAKPAEITYDESDGADTDSNETDEEIQF